LQYHSSAQILCKSSTQADIDEKMLIWVSFLFEVAASAVAPLAQLVHRQLHCRLLKMPGANQQLSGHHLHATA
jgi:hypothetical protein